MKSIQLIIFLFALAIASCKKFIEIDPPRTELIKSTVFANDATANAAMMDVYYALRAGGWASGNTGSVSFLTTLSSDEQINYSVVSKQQFNDNAILPDNIDILGMWSGLYSTIYKVNAIIEGVSQSQGVSSNLKTQLEGEAKFIRAFSYFYLVNLWGDVPLITTTDYQVNAALPRSPISDVYVRIISDLKDAQNLLPDNWAFAGNERVRANKWAATAMLARVYLYTQDWVNAEAQSTSVISNAGLFSLKTNVNDVFLINNTEAILQWWSNFRPNDRVTFRTLSPPPLFGAYRPAYGTSFELNDQRNGNWMSFNFGYYNARKYKATNDNPAVEYSTVLRLAEQYLIRAEARAKQNKITGTNSAESDVNVIRSRAGLGMTSANTQTSMLAAIDNERKWELFSEWGHRWLDLKRTGQATAIIAPIKGSNWQVTDVLYPIPAQQILNSTVTQNPGY